MVRLVIRGFVAMALVLVSLVLINVQRADAAQPSAADALGLKPIQADVDFDVPDEAAAKKCTIDVVKSNGVSGWTVTSSQGERLRRFLDTNADNKVDMWCYFKGGIEVYRDIDSDYNGKVDQYRWLGTAGTRWAQDTNEDGRIDRWKVISPEELTAEVVAALGSNDVARFTRVLLSKDELKGLALGPNQTDRLAKKIAATATGFENLARRQKFVDKSAHWVNFGGTRPGIVPAGTDGSKRDLEVYENVAAVIQSGDTHSQVVIGTLVRVGRAWRVIDIPRDLSDDQASIVADGFFFQAPLGRHSDSGMASAGGLSSEVQELITRLGEIDEDLATATTLEALGPLNAQRADVLEGLAKAAASDEDHAQWLRQLADTTSAAIQTGGYPDGVARLQALVDQLADQKKSPELVAYIKFCCLTAEYNQNQQESGTDYAQVQAKWIGDLEEFVDDYPGTSGAADAMLQLAMADEFGGKDEQALKWYARIASEFSTSPVATKATGAQRRLESVGKKLSLKGTDTEGNSVSIESFLGKVVLVHYWGTSYRPSLLDLSVLKDMLAKYGKENVALVGINVDYQREKFAAYLDENPLPWPQLYAPGGLDDSPLATHLGISMLPTMLLLDREGKVVARNLHAGEIDGEFRKLLR